jgi:glycogenin glucosyltransferase
MSDDRGLFHAPSSYSGARYQAPGEAPAAPKPIFPWEASAPRPTRVFAEDAITSPPIAPSRSEISTTGETQDAKSTPTTPAASGTGAESEAWQTYPRGNAWDEVPDIEKYVSDMQRAKKGKLQVLVGAEDEVMSPGPDERPSMKVTDFPTEVERPSLPVTPAPIRRPSFWGQERDGAGQLPPAEGVPDQAQWV